MTKEILIAAGHSNADPGAIAKTGQKEAELALVLRDLVAQCLRGLGAKFVTDGVMGSNAPLSESIKLAKGRFAVELHFNASANPDAHGVECIGHSSMRYHCQELAKAVRVTTGATLRGDCGHIDPSKSARGKLGFCDAGGVILEICFLSNQAELSKFEVLRHQLAKKIAETIVKVNV